MEPLFFFFGLLRGCLCLAKSGETISGLKPHNALLQAETEHIGAILSSSYGHVGHRLNPASVRRCHDVLQVRLTSVGLLSACY